jgi:RNA recognition motif-containing protein
MGCGKPMVGVRGVPRHRLLPWFIPQLPIILMTIYVGNLSYQATVDDLTDVFAEYGAVKRVSLPVDRETGRMRGFAFVELEEDTQENSAIAELDGAEWMGRQLKVNKAKPKEARAS